MRQASRFHSSLADDLHGLVEEIVGALIVIGIAALNTLVFEFLHFGSVGVAQFGSVNGSAELL
jgi:hypothetical protein